MQRAIEKMLGEIQYYYDTIPADGGCDEGTSYWGRAGASLFEFIYQLKLASDGAFDLFDDEKLHRIAAYMQKVHVVDAVFYNVADTHIKGKAGLMPLLFAFAKETGQEALAGFAAGVYAKKEDGSFLPHTTCTLRRLILEAQALREMASYRIAQPLHGAIEHLAELQIAALRRGAFTLHAKGGHNKEGHNHNDVGSFTFYDGSTPVLVDVGINTYTGLHFKRETRYTAIPWTRSHNHNLPLINGVEQKSAKEHCADAFEVQEGRIAVSFADAYPAESGVEKLTRVLQLAENGMKCTDTFAFASKGASAVTEVLMAVLPVRLENDAVILGECYAVRAAGAKISTEYIPFEDKALEADWCTQGVTRILLDFENVEKICIEVEKL